MKHECKIMVLETKVFPDLQEKYLADPKSGPCPFFHVGDEFLLERTPEKDDFYHLMNGKFCGEAWDAVSRYVYTALQGGSIMQGWTNDDRMMIACCNDGTRPVIFKIERVDIPENDEEREWLEKHDFRNTAEDAYTGEVSQAWEEDYGKTKHFRDEGFKSLSVAASQSGAQRPVEGRIGYRH